VAPRCYYGCPMALQAPARIIVVDDDSSVREALEMILAGAGHTIRGRGTACGAAALLWEQLPQLVVPPTRCEGGKSASHRLGPCCAIG
jgi:DNA-binding NtrC family response regulator